MKTIEKFFRKHNSFWSIAILAVLIMAGVNFEMDGFKSIPISILIGVVLAFLFVNEYVESYISYEKGKLLDIVKYQKFDGEGYFKTIGIRLLAYAGVFVVANVIMGCVEFLTLNMVRLAAVLVGMLATFFVKKMLFMYKLNNRISIRLNLFEKLMSIVTVVLKFIVAIFFGFMYMMVAYSILISRMTPIDQSQIMFVAYQKNYMMGYVFATMFFTMFGLVYNKKRVNLIMCALSVACIVTAAFTVYGDYNYRVVMGEHDIKVYEGSKTYEYTYEDISGYEIRFDHDMQMELSFEDGKRVTLLNASFENSTKWDETYDSQYHYVAYLVDVVKSNGGSGTIKDKGKIEEQVNTLSSECQEGYKLILENMK